MKMKADNQSDVMLKVFQKLNIEAKSIQLGYPYLKRRKREVTTEKTVQCSN
jgi:hypothetical protein